MARKNYSLSSELRSNEAKRQSKIQNRQKYEHQMETLQRADPVALYRRLQRLKTENLVSTKQKKQLKKLEDDWKFILKHELHKNKVEQFLKNVQKEEDEKQRLKNKLWGAKSVYFNPELNPLGKVPDASKIKVNLAHPLENLTIPLKRNQMTKYDPDPLIEKLGIKPPPGDPPRFYKQVYNIEGAQNSSSIEAPSTVADENEHNDQPLKKQKIE